MIAGQLPNMGLTKPYGVYLKKASKKSSIGGWKGFQEVKAWLVLGLESQKDPSIQLRGKGLRVFVAITSGNKLV